MSQTAYQEKPAREIPVRPGADPTDMSDVRVVDECGARNAAGPMTGGQRAAPHHHEVRSRHGCPIRRCRATSARAGCDPRSPCLKSPRLQNIGRRDAHPRFGGDPRVSSLDRKRVSGIAIEDRSDVNALAGAFERPRGVRGGIEKDRSKGDLSAIEDRSKSGDRRRSKVDLNPIEVFIRGPSRRRFSSAVPTRSPR